MRCAYASSGCNGPSEGECMGLCTHRVNTEMMTKPVVAIKGRVEQRVETKTLPNGDLQIAIWAEELPIQFAEPEPSPIACAWDAYTTHRARGRLAALRHALRAFRSAR